MIKHIVLWKLKVYAEGASRDQNAVLMKKALEGLPAKIPQIRRFEVGINFTRSDAACDVALYSEFANEQDLEAYAKHPEHLRVADFIARIRESRVVADYRVE